LTRADILEDGVVSGFEEQSRYVIVNGRGERRIVNDALTSSAGSPAPNQIPAARQFPCGLDAVEGAALGTAVEYLGSGH